MFFFSKKKSILATLEISKWCRWIKHMCIFNCIYQGRKSFKTIFWLPLLYSITFLKSYQTWVVSPMSIWIRAQLPGEIRYNSCHINVTKSVRSLSTRQWHIGSNSSLWLRIPTLTEICPSRLVSWVPKTITVYFSRVSWIKEIHAKGLFTTSKSSQRVLHLPFQTHRECF